jgi:hypothetical protein
MYETAAQKSTLRKGQKQMVNAICLPPAWNETARSRKRDEQKKAENELVFGIASSLSLSDDAREEGAGSAEAACGRTRGMASGCPSRTPSKGDQAASLQATYFRLHRSDWLGMHDASLPFFSAPPQTFALEPVSHVQAMMHQTGLAVH